MVFVVIVAAMSFSVRISSLSLHGYLDGPADEANGYSSSSTIVTATSAPKVDVDNPTTDGKEVGSEKKSESESSQPQSESSSQQQPPTRYAVLHIGPHKTGTSALQASLLGMPKALEADNYRILKEMPGIAPGPKAAAFLAHCFIDESERGRGRHKAGWDGCPEDKRKEILEAFEKFITYDTKNLIISSEEFDRRTFDVAAFHEYFVKHNLKVHVVAYYRRYYDWLRSYHNQYAKHGLITKDLIEWLTVEEIDNMQGIFTEAAVKRYIPFRDVNVTIVNIHGLKEKNLTSLSSFACEHIPGESDHMCREAKAAKARSSNPSVNLDRYILAQFLEQKGGLEKSFLSKINDKITAASASWWSDLPKKCLADDVKDKLLDVSIQIEKALTPEAWHNGDDGIKNLRSDFEQKAKSQLCSIDAEAVIESKEWQDFIREEQGIP